jgi:transposase
MWTAENRARYDRSKLRYPSDLADEKWALIAPAKKGGNKRTADVRAVLNGVMDVLSTGCQWAALPKDLPARSTVNDYLRRWDDDRTLARIHHTLCAQCRAQAG